jgi:hypothetical protein
MRKRIQNNIGFLQPADNLGPIQNFLRTPIQHGRMFKGMFSVFVRIGAVTALGQA